ncbi:salicylate hydroxylase [Podospora australis]|uniref:Salicylate hydroxylase n=1 Tax=Podospora australis TaxID=1536484 RepID=A0AAN6WWM0_9PEZI|nr:salicylate hydroxylase [Podospora australis]
MPSAIPTRKEAPFEVAIIGAGIVGVTLSLGLLARNIPFTLYERASSFREIGAGIGFSPNAERAMGLLSPDILSAFKRVANPNGEDYFQWVDGFSSDQNKLMYKLHVGKDGFQGCRRSDILEEWAKLLPANRVQFGKEISSLIDSGTNNGGVRLEFTDGTSAKASVVIGCDGIRSRVRQHVLSKASPSATPGYTRKFCYRALVDMNAAIAKPAIGKGQALTRFMYNGPRAHVITYPVGNNTLMNVLVVLSDPKQNWPEELVKQGKHTADGSKAEVVNAFKEWNPTVREIVELLPEESTLEKWAIFDMAEHRAETYAKGRVCIAGDAAHATGPHLGAGGGLGIEDALCLAGLMEVVQKRCQQDGNDYDEKMVVEAALKAYNDVRYDRTQWVVQATREAVDLFHWTNKEVGSDAEKFGREITQKFHRIWEYDVQGMVKEALGKMDGLAG